MKMVSTILQPLMIGCSWECMLDIIWNAVEDEYLTIIMYLLCSIPMRFSGKTSQMIHNERDDERGRTPHSACASQRRDSQPSATSCAQTPVASRVGVCGREDRPS